MKRIVLVSACLLLLLSSMQAQSNALRPEVESLRGLKGVRVTVMFGRADALDVERRPEILKLLQADAEAKFMKAGIPLLKYAQDVENAPGSPHLILTITMDKPNGHVFPVVTHTKLFQKALLPRDPSIQLSLPTWETYGIGDYQLTNMEMLRLQVGGEVDQFIKAYLTVNAKPAE